MSDKSDNHSAEDPGPLCGERLAAAREELQISIVEIAKELHLDEQKVQSLENNDFAPLGAPVFAKGHLKKYAQLVKVEVDDILFDYHQLTRSEGLPPVVSTRKAPRIAASPTPWIASAVVILIVAAAALAWFFMLGPGSDTVDPVAEPSLPVEQSVPGESSSANEVADASGASDDGVIEDVLERQQEPVAEPDTAAQEPLEGAVVPVAAAPSSSPASVEPGQLALDLNFVGDCWTEITDGSGRRLFFDLGRTGRTISVAGDAPLSVLLGNAENVRLKLNGVDYSISDGDRRGQTARLTLAAP